MEASILLDERLKVQVARHTANEYMREFVFLSLLYAAGNNNSERAKAAINGYYLNLVELLNRDIEHEAFDDLLFDQALNRWADGIDSRLKILQVINSSIQLAAYIFKGNHSRAFAQLQNLNKAMAEARK